MGTGRCSPNSRVAFQPLGFDSIALLSHSTCRESAWELVLMEVPWKVFGEHRSVPVSRLSLLDNAAGRVVLKMLRRGRSVSSSRGPG